MKAFLLVAVYMVFYHVSFSQNVSRQDLNAFSESFRMEKNRNKTVDPAYRGIEGSPYLNEEFTAGEVTLDDSIHFEKVPLRYNIYTGKMESLNKEVVIELELANRAYTFQFGGSLFTGLQYVAGDRENYGILELIADGTARLYKKLQIILKPSTKASGYSKAEPDRFVRLDDEYLIAIGQGQPELFRNASELIEKLESHKPGIQQYAKSKKLKLKSEKGLIQLVQYYNETNMLRDNANTNGNNFQ